MTGNGRAVGSNASGRNPDTLRRLQDYSIDLIHCAYDASSPLVQREGDRRDQSAWLMIIWAKKRLMI